MIENRKLFNLITRGGFVLLNLISFLIFFIPYYVLEIPNGDWEYLIIFSNKLSEFALPAIGGALVFIAYPTVGFKGSLIGSLLYALPRAVFLLPYYYLYFTAYGYAYDEALLLGGLVTLFGVVLFALHIFLLFLIGRAVYEAACIRRSGSGIRLRDSLGKRRAEYKAAAISARGELPSELRIRGIFNFELPVCVGIFSLSLTEFTVYLIEEINDTVVYISEAGFFMPSEIIYIVLSYVFLLIELLLCHTLSCLIKDAVKYNVTNKTSEKERKKGELKWNR